MRILLNNDGELYPPDIQILAKHLHEFAKLQVVVPDLNHRLSSNLLTLESSLRMFTLNNDDTVIYMETRPIVFFWGGGIDASAP